MAWNVYVFTPGVAVSIAAAFQAPVMGGLLSDCAGSGGGVDPTQIEKLSGKALNCKAVCGVTVTFNVNGDAHSPAVGVKTYVPLVVLLMTAGLQVPVTAGTFDELVDSVGTAEPAQIVKLPVGNAVNDVVGAGVTVTLIVAGVAQTVAFGVNVYEPLAVLLIVAGLQVPAKPSIEVAGNDGGVVPAQKGAIGLKVGATFWTTLTDMVTGVAETHCPGFGMNVLVLTPSVVVLMVVGFHVPEIPLVDVGNAGAVEF